MNIYFAYKYIFIGHKYLNIECIFEYGTHIFTRYNIATYITPYISII